MTKEQAEEAAQRVEAVIAYGAEDDETQGALRRAAHALRAYWPMRSALESVEWESRNAGENTYCPWCGVGADRFSDQTAHFGTCPRESALALARKEP